MLENATVTGEFADGTTIGSISHPDGRLFLAASSAKLTLWIEEPAMGSYEIDVELPATPTVFIEVTIGAAAKARVSPVASSDSLSCGSN